MTTPLAELLALYERRSSARGYLAEPLPSSALRSVFAAAQRAPSWCNVQPWRVAVTSPPQTAAVTAALVAAASADRPHGPESGGSDVPFPTEYPQPYLEHRRACGGALYKAMDIARDDQVGRRSAWLRNYQAFDAPHLAVVSCDRRLGSYAYVDVGVWLGYLLLACESAGIATCPMASIASFPTVLRRLLPISVDEDILFGIALGFADGDHPANRCRTARQPVEANVQFVE
jgi:nitroreductase